MVDPLDPWLVTLDPRLMTYDLGGGSAVHAESMITTCIDYIGPSACCACCIRGTVLENVIV